MIIYQITRTLARGEVEAVWLPLQRLLEELLEAGGQAAQVQLLAPAHQLQHLLPQLLIGALPLCTGVLSTRSISICVLWTKQQRLAPDEGKETEGCVCQVF